MARKPKFTPAQIKNHIKNIQEAMKKLKREHEQRGEQFVSITPEEIEKKLKRVHSPIIGGEAWNQTTPGGTVLYTLYIYNPDPTQTIFVFAQAWVGSGNVDPTVGTFLLNVDTRFPQLKQPSNILGMQLASNSIVPLDFTLQVPTTVERTNYFLQSCLMQVNYFGVGTYLDRAMVVLNVT